MASIDLTDFKGLVTAPGLLERAEASFIEATNWEFPAPGVMRKRRGTRKLEANAGGPVWKLHTSRLLAAQLLAHIGTGTTATSMRVGDGTGAGLTALTMIDSGNLTRSRDVRQQSAVCQRNHYLTGDEGVARLESDIGADIRFAGMPRGQGVYADGTLAAGLPFKALSGSGTNIPDGYARSYRVTWHRKDADGVELGGAPTTRFVIPNRNYITGYTGAARAALMYLAVPNEYGTTSTALTTDYYWRLWATRTYDEATQLGDDEMYLVTEAYLTAPQIAAGYVTNVLDATPDDFLLSSPRLHTNLVNFPPSEVGIRQGVVNEDAPPPAANDLAYWQDVMWYGDITTRPTITVGLIALPADGDTVTVDYGGATVVFTCRTVPAATTDFLRFAAGPTTSINIRETALALVAAINTNYISDGLTAFHVSTTATQPGIIILEATRPALTLSFTPATPTVWQGYDGYDVTTGSAVGALSLTNQLAFSKPVRADAVPPINRLSVGPRDATILRIYPLRDRLLVFTDYGIFQVTGRTYADFAVYPFDLGYRLIGRDLVALCDERVYAWCYEGIIEIDDSGVKVVSAAIEPSIEDAIVSAGGGSGDTVLQDGRDALAAQGFAVGYHNQHQVRFHYPQADDPADVNGCAAWFTFDTRTRLWAQGIFNLKTFAGYFDARSCGVVRLSDDLLALGCWSAGSDTFLFLERRKYDSSDFSETARDNTTQLLVSSATIQYQVPDARGAQHWQQTVINWDAEEFTWRTLPTSIDLTWTTEEATASSANVPVTELATRDEPPIDTRRGQRLRVGITHSEEEYAGVVGFTQDYASGSRFARRVAP